MKDFHDAFTDANGKRKDNTDAPAMLEFLAKFTGMAPETIDKATPYVDPQGRIDMTDIRSQVAWYTAQGQIRGEVKADVLVDARYAIPLPGTK
jgi:NitT/TauT family transport system substrate-binding protein